MRVLLTGSSGYLGRVLTRHLAAAEDVTAFTCLARTAPADPLPPKGRFVSMDIRDPALAEVVARHDAVIHAACVVLWPARMPAAERDAINEGGTANIAKAARRQGIRRFIHAGSMAAYDPGRARGRSDLDEDFPRGTGESRFYYWNSKARAEEIIDEVLAGSGTVVTHLRPIYIMGPGNRAAVKRYRGEAVNLAGHDPRRQFIHEDDVAAAFLHALRTDLPGAYNVVPDDSLRMSEVWKIVGAKKVRTVPLVLARAVAWLRWRFAGSEIHPSWVEDMLVDFTGSNARLRDAGWTPAFTSREALEASLGAPPAETP